MALYTATYDSPLGPIFLAAEEEALVALWLPGQMPDARLIAQAQPRADAPPLKAAREWLDRYFCGGRPTPQELALAPWGSAFRQRVWQRLCRIPYGQVTTYGEIARELAAETGTRMSAQAVGGAVGHNPISLIIPCHRVIGAGGNLVGYAGGLALKKRLLKYEGIAVQMLHDPPQQGGGKRTETTDR